MKRRRTRQRGVLAEAGIGIPVVAVVKDERHQPREVIGTRRAGVIEADAVLANADAHRFSLARQDSRSAFAIWYNTVHANHRQVAARRGCRATYEVSLKSGATILANLPEERFVAHDIYIDKNGQWHDRGRPTTPERIVRQIDVALIGLHGEYGEDGKVQKPLERFGIPYAGADSFGSYLATPKLMAKHRAKEAGTTHAGVPLCRTRRRRRDGGA